MSNYLIHFNPNHDKLGRFATGVSVGSKAVKSISNELPNRLNKYDKKGPRADLSSVSTKDLNDIINRERLERQYDDYFNTPVESKGKQVFNKIMQYAGDVAVVVGPIAVAVTAMLIDAKQRSKNMTPVVSGPRFTKTNTKDMNFFS